MGNERASVTTEEGHTSTPEPEASGSSRKAGGFRWASLWPIAAIVGVVVVLYLVGAAKYFSLSFIVREHESLAALVGQNIILATIAYVVVYVVAVAVSFPGASLLTIVGGIVFGTILGTILTVLAATAGATLIFLAAKTSVGAFLRTKASGFAERFAKGFEENAFSYLFLIRLMPVFPFWLVNIAPTLFNVRVGTYIAATALGIIPGTLAYSLLGDGLGATIKELEMRDPGCAEAGTCQIGAGVLLSPGPLIAMVGLVAVALIPLVVKKVRARREKTS
ncbi:MAG: TVP38/TMEM64 family protein [Pseudomonadota bacterium]